MSVWDPPPAGQPGPSRPARYLAVMGTSGAGKSTLVRRLASDFFPGSWGIAIDESDTHHPFLERLFQNPTSYAFELQCNFMLQRVLIVKRWLDANVSVVMERSHFDDPVFMEHLSQGGHADPAEADAYDRLWNVLSNRVRWPDIIIALRIPAQLSIERISQAEAEGRRPKEFASEEQKADWLTRWAAIYERRIASLEADSRIAERLIVVDYTTPYDAIRDLVAGRLDT